MENAAKALAIAGGILIALIILAGLIYMFTRMRMIPEQQDYKKQVEQISEFNQQFEAYQKKLMYGADVISCLNKVIDNNKKSEEYTGGKYNITFSVTIKSDIEDRVEIYYLDDKDKKEKRLMGGNSIDKKFHDIFPNVNYDDTKKISSIQGGDSIEVNNYSSNFKTGTYTLDISRPDDDWLMILSKSTTDIQKLAVNPSNNEEELKKWTKVIWYTSAYDFKSKRFRCDGIGYDNTEGRVNSISFTEYKK